MANQRDTDKVKLRQKKSSDLKNSLFLDWYDGNGKRIKEYLKLTIFQKPNSVFEKHHNKETLSKANILRTQKESQIFSGEFEEVVQLKKAKNQDFRNYFKNYLESYAQKDKRVVSAVYNHFDYFAATNITVKGITEQFCIDFQTYLHKELNGESPQTYFARFKKMLHYATRYSKLFRISPAYDIKNSKTSNSLTKEVLTIEELKSMVDANCGNEEVKRAFLFACNTGLRFSDIKTLKWSNIKGNALEIQQSKTKEKSSDGGKVVVSLNETAKELLFQNEVQGKNKNSLVFKLPSHNAVLDNLHHWTKRANIEKHITFHCARHTFGTLLAYYGNDINLISKLLGHTSLKHTSKYVRIAEEMKERAVNSIPSILN